MKLLFDQANQHATVWVKHMMAEMGTSDPHKAWHALRAGLHALRDGLTVEQAAQLSAQLPLLVRGLFFEGWVPKETPLPIRNKAEFISLVREAYAPHQDPASDVIVAAIFKLLAQHVSMGELTNVAMRLPEELVEAAQGGWPRDESPFRHE